MDNKVVKKSVKQSAKKRAERLAQKGQPLIITTNNKSLESG